MIVIKIGLIDCDNFVKIGSGGGVKVGSFPNLPLMKLSAHHKELGDEVGWYDGNHCDVVYMSKVFSFSGEPEIEIDADKVIRGGTGYSIKLKDGKEFFDTGAHRNLPSNIEHIYPDYSLYGITDTAYGFLTRGCPRSCSFCHVAPKEGRASVKVADLSEFWDGQKYIQIMDPNTFACPDWKEVCTQLIESKAYIDFNQGVDIRLLNDEKISYLQEMKIKSVHFAWDRYGDKDIIVPRLRKIKEATGWGRDKVNVYVLVNFDTTIEQDVERVNTIRDLDFSPYVQRYNKKLIPRGSDLNKLARWCNRRQFLWKYPSLDAFKEDERNTH